MVGGGQDRGARRAHKPGERPAPPWERDGHVVRLGSLPLARRALRERRSTIQAGFTAEYIPKGALKHHPILMSDGPAHDQQRAKVARFFAPRVVAERHAPGIERVAESYVGRMQADRGGLLDEVALHYAVEVTADIVGLTAAEVPRLAARLESFFRQPPFDLTQPGLGRSRRDWARAAAAGLGPLARFGWHDVRPAIRARRRHPRADIISHLIAEGYTDLDILVECLTYGTAGMVTTREFIVMAAWHLLTTDDLRADYLAADTAARHAILHELIRVEPVVGHLYRRATHQFELDAGGQRQVFPGDLIDVDVRQANLDPDWVGEDASQVCPGRAMAPGVDAAGLSFGDGAHRCPGQPLAITETDALLVRLLRAGAQLESEPTLAWVDLVEGYTLRGLRISLPGDSSSTSPHPPPGGRMTRTDATGMSNRTGTSNQTGTSDRASSTRDDFDRGAKHYDLMVALNPGYHRELDVAARSLAQRLGDAPSTSLIDLACGSGASTRALVNHTAASTSILGLDASAGMLAQARRKHWPARVRFDQAVSGDLPIDQLGAGSHDGVQCCYLLRNVPADDRDRAVAEIFALLRPGGWLVVQEYSVSDSRLARWVWHLVCHAIIIPLAFLLGGERHLYRYLWRSVLDFDSVAQVGDRLQRAGFTGVEHRTARGWQRHILHTFAAQKPEGHQEPPLGATPRAATAQRSPASQPRAAGAGTKQGRLRQSSAPASRIGRFLSQLVPASRHHHPTGLSADSQPTAAADPSTRPAAGEVR